MKEYLVSYREGSSPYWYNRTVYAASPAEAADMINRDPYTIPAAIKVKEL